MISVVVATRNRASALRRTLARFAETSWARPEPPELLVVDNGSTDETATVIREFAGTAPFPVHGLHEPQPGVARARNRGLAHARHPLIAFTDDDCLVAPDWMDAFARIFEQSPDAGLVGGRVRLADPDDAPVARRDIAEPAAIDSWGALRGHLIGCNFAVRRAVVERIGGFDVGLGVGTRARSSEDLDFFYRAWQAGVALAYSPEPVVEHAHGRRDPAEVSRLQRSYIRGRAAFYGKHLIRGHGRLLRPLYYEFRRATPRIWAVMLLGLSIGAFRPIRNACRLPRSS